MSDILELAEKLQDTQAALSRLEKSAAQNPNLPSIALSLNSLRNRQKSLEEQFGELADSLGVDVCSYRMFPEKTQRPTVKTLTSALSDFQTLFTEVYNAIKKGARERGGRVTGDVLAETSFGYAYSFTGSVGFVLTLPNEKLLLGETVLDTAMRVISDMVKAETPEQIAAFKDELGLAPIRSMYKWAEDHTLGGIGADIQWRRQQEVRTSIFVQQPQLENLRRTIARTSEIDEKEYHIEGQLVGLDTKYKTFHLEVEGIPDIKGKILFDIDPAHPIACPAFYRVNIRTETIIHYSTAQEDVSYFLVSLE